MNIQCPRCKSDSVNVLNDQQTVAYKTNSITFNTFYSLCTDCNKEFVAPIQQKQNDESIKNAKREHDGLLSPKRIYQIRANLGLSQAQAAVIFGGGTNGFSKYERGEILQSQSMDTLLWVCEKHPFIVDEIIDRLQLPLRTTKSRFHSTEIFKLSTEIPIKASELARPVSKQYKKKTFNFQISNYKAA